MKIFTIANKMINKEQIDNINEKEDTFSKNNFKRFDITKSFKMFKYKTRFTLDYANINYGYNSVRGSTGLVNILFSDILGDYRVLVNTEMQINLKCTKL